MEDFNGILLNDSDNVVTTLRKIYAQGYINAAGLDQKLFIKEVIPGGHKAARCFIAAGSPVIKYGKKIGRAVKDIEEGEHVHTHNIISCRGKGLRGDKKDD